jgi:outer membrane biosynthesis protein TonB
MLTKILLIGTFILLAWSTYVLTNKSQYIMAQNTKLIELQGELKKQQETIIQNADKQMKLLVTNNKASESAIKSVADKISKVEVAVDKLKKTIATKKPAAKKKPSAKPKPAAKPKAPAKPKPAAKQKAEAPQKAMPKKPDNADAELELTKKLNSVNELHKQGSIEAASTALTEFKGLIWKNRKDERVTKETVLSIISSIDYTLKKWNEKELTYDLSKVNEKFKTFFSKKEASK